MNWFRNLFGKPTNEDTGPSEIAIRTAEIQARIAAFKSSYPWTETSNKASQVSTQPMVATKESPINNKPSESDILKAKLLGKKL